MGGDTRHCIVDRKETMIFKPKETTIKPTTMGQLEGVLVFAFCIDCRVTNNIKDQDNTVMER